MHLQVMPHERPVHGRHVCTLTVGREIPYAAVGLMPEPGVRHDIMLLYCNEANRLIGVYLLVFDTGLPCELQFGNRESIIQVGILETLAPLRGQMNHVITCLRQRLACDLFDTVGCLVDEQLALLTA